MKLSRVVQNFSAVTAMRVLTILLSFPFFVILARKWDASSLGAFTLLWALFFIGRELSLLGLHLPLIRDVAQAPEELSPFSVNTMLIGFCVAGVLFLAFGIGGSALYPREVSPAFWLLGASMFPTVATGVSESILISEQRMVVSSMVNAAEAIIRTVIWIVLVLGGFGLTSLLFVLVLTRIGSAIVFLGPVGIGRRLKLSDLSRATLRRLLLLAPAFFGILLLQSGIHRIDFIILSKLGTLEQTGLYSAPYKIIEGFLLLPTILTMVLMPVLARLFGDSRVRGEELTRGVIRFVLTLGLPCAVLLALVSEPFLVLLFGEQFRASAAALAWLAVVPVSTAVAQTLSMALQANHRQDLDLRAVAVTLAAYATALFILIPSFGFIGAAAATTGADLLQASIRYHFCRKRLALRLPLTAFVPQVLAAALMAIAGYSRLFASLPANMAVALLVYVAVLAAVGGVTRRDVSITWQYAVGLKEGA